MFRITWLYRKACKGAETKYILILVIGYFDRGYAGTFWIFIGETMTYNLWPATCRLDLPLLLYKHHPPSFCSVAEHFRITLFYINRNLILWQNWACCHLANGKVSWIFFLHYHYNKAVIAAKQNYSVITFIQQMDEIVMCENITGKNLQFILSAINFFFRIGTGLRD